jgi:DNA-binding CsgD family transcriptional regulator
MMSGVASRRATGGSSPLLVGRERELALLREALAESVAGQGTLVLVGGEAGIGKTALARRLKHEAVERGALVLVGHGDDLGETPPYGPWLELLGQYAPAGDLPLPPASLARVGAPGDVSSQAALFAEVVAFLAALAAHQPLVLLLDDVHRADPASLDLLRFLARRCADLPLLLIVTYRSDEVTRQNPLSAVLPVLARAEPAARLNLRRLAPEDVRTLVGLRYRLAGPDEDRLVAFLEARAEGNPFFIGELLRTLEEEGVIGDPEAGGQLGDLAQVRLPVLLRQVIDGRLARLGEEAQRLLAIAAVIGQEVPLDLWMRVAEVDEEVVLGVVERAVEAHVLEESADGTRARFVHALIREALYEGLLPVLLPSRRRVWHRRIGEVLAAAPTPDPDAVASHFRRAGDPRAEEWLVRAGERAQGAWAYLSAAERYAAALAVAEARGADARERGWLRFRLARVRRFADGPGSLADLDAAACLAGEAGDPVLAAQATADRGWVRCTLGDIRRGIAELEEGVAALEALPAAERAGPEALRFVDPHHRAGALAAWCAFVGRYAEARALGERLVVAASPPVASAKLDGSGYADAANGLALALAALGRPAEAGQAFGRSRAAYQAVGHLLNVGEVALAELRTVVLTYQADQLGERERLATIGEQAWAAASAVRTDLPARLARLPLLVVQGNWAEAEDLASATRGSPVFSAYAARELSPLARARGDAALAERLVREAMPDGPAMEPGGSRYLNALVLQRLAVDLALDAGDLATARAWLEAHDRWLAWSGAVAGQAEGQLGWARYHQTAGDLAEASRHAAAALERAAEPRQPLALLAGHPLAGEIATASGRFADADAHLLAALALADACAAPYERALTLLALTELRQTSGEAGADRALLAEVRAICTSLGAAPALARAARLANGAASVTPAHAAGLTAREVEILRLIAAGRTDREIAATLLLSERTVNHHVAHILAKTGAENRTMAAGFALRHGLA